MRWLFLAFITVLFASCGKKTTPSSHAPAEPAGGWVQGIGYVEPAGEVRRLSFLYPGIVGEVLTDVGAEVSKGDVLMRQTDRAERAALAEAEATLATAQAEYQQTLAGVNPERIRALEATRTASEAAAINARRDYERFDQLLAKGVVSQLERDHGETEALRAEASFKQAEAELANLRLFVRVEDIAVAGNRMKLAEARVATVRTRLLENELRAPMTGQVLELLHREGESTHGLTPEPVLVFADSGRLRVRAEIEESYALQLRPGQDAEVFGRGLGQRKIEGRVSLVKAIMGKKTVFTKSSTERKDLDVLQVLIDLPEGTTLPVGFEVDVRINRAVGRDALFRRPAPSINLREASSG
jgi:HlyD family secretion protein